MKLKHLTMKNAKASIIIWMISKLWFILKFKQFNKRVNLVNLKQIQKRCLPNVDHIVNILERLRKYI
jgi:hypothetical protein